jgi:copper(I)-binding protein
MRFIALLCAAASLASVPAFAGPVEVENAWVREGPPTSRVLAGYMQVHNRSDAPITLTGASSPAMARVELHRTEIRDGVARMVALERVEIAAGGSLTFEPGGLHLMLFDPVEPLRAGDRIELDLAVEGAGAVSAEAEVRRMTGADTGHAHHHHQ